MQQQQQQQHQQSGQHYGQASTTTTTTTTKRKSNGPDSGPTAKSMTAVVARPSLSGWQNGLKAALSDPDQVLFADSQCSIIADKYPKARHHYLVMPRRHVDCLAGLTTADAGLLRHMLTVAKDFVKGQNLEQRAFRYGFHAVPSMRQLHMHAISQDFVSPSLKNKKHWLSFTTQFFLDCDHLLRVLEQAQGESANRASRVTLTSDSHRLAIDEGWFSALIKSGQLKCNQCDKICKNMPELKLHLSWHHQRLQATAVVVDKQ